MQEAFARLLERQANLDKQWERAFVLDQLGIWVWDDDKGRPNIVLSKQARELNDKKYRSIRRIDAN